MYRCMVGYKWLDNDMVIGLMVGQTCRQTERLIDGWLVRQNDINVKLDNWLDRPINRYM